MKVFGGHSYAKHKVSKNEEIQFCRCKYKNSRVRCNARLWTSIATDEVVWCEGYHSDAPDPVAVEISTRKTALESRAIETQETTAKVVTSIRRTASRPAKARLENDRTLSRMVQRARKKADTISEHCDDRVDIN